MIESEANAYRQSYLSGTFHNFYGPDHRELNRLRRTLESLLTQSVFGANLWAELKPLFDNPQRYGRIYASECTLDTPVGMVSIYCWYGRPEEAEQIWRFSTVIDGYEYTLRQRRTPRDFLTEVGAKRVAHRWLRDLRNDLRKVSVVPGVRPWQDETGRWHVWK